MHETNQLAFNLQQTKHFNSLPPGLRGNYEVAKEGFEVVQNWDDYSEADHDRWRRLYQRQLHLIDQFAASSVRDVIQELNCADGIPDCNRISEQLFQKNGWRLVSVPGLIPSDAFFTHIAAKRFPVTVWIREEHEFDFVQEPDIFHDFFGHVAMLFNPVYCDALAAFAQKWLQAAAVFDMELMTRVYWYIFEYGLIVDQGKLKVFGAALLSSCGEIGRSIQSRDPCRFRFTLDRCLRTEYEIYNYQNCYFVIDSLDDLMRKCEVDILSACADALNNPSYQSSDRQPSELHFCLE